VDERKFGCVVPSAKSYESEQGSTYAPGVSAETVGSQALFLGLVTRPPGGRTRAHIHAHHESAFYMLSGEDVELWTGEQLERKDVAQPGDFLFIPAKVPYVAVNRSASTPAVFVGVRNEPTAQESVVMLPDFDERVP